MKRLTLSTLIVNDDDVECKTDSDLSKMTLANLGFIPPDLDKYDLIVYQGKRGSKILKSKHTKIGEIR